MRARLIPVSDIALSMRELWADSSRKPFVTDAGAYIPVRDGHPYSHTIPERSRSGRGYQKLGDLILFHGKRPGEPDISEIIGRENPRGILWISGHDGALRKPRIELIYGSGGEVVHRESGIEYLLDVQQVMFSQGNREEKTRVASLVKPGERVGDMFAGIGYFTLGMARAGATVHAMELNPASYRYLIHNIQVNGLSGSVHASMGDCRDLMTGLYDRIHMGYFDALSYLPRALNHAGPGTTLHVHMLNNRSEEIGQIVRRSGFEPEIIVNKVKKAGPRIWHMVGDVVIR